MVVFNVYAKTIELTKDVLTDCNDDEEGDPLLYMLLQGIFVIVFVTIHVYLK